MKPLIVLLIFFAITATIANIRSGAFKFAQSARIALSVMLVFTATAHFIYTEGMTMMIPTNVPFKIELVYITGIIELLAAIGLFIPTVRVVTAWVLILFFVLILPANINASRNHIDYQKATFEGYGLAYLWFRVPLQMFFIAWTYISSIRFNAVS